MFHTTTIVLVGTPTERQTTTTKFVSSLKMLLHIAKSSLPYPMLSLNVWAQSAEGAFARSVHKPGWFVLIVHKMAQKALWPMHFSGEPSSHTWWLVILHGLFPAQNICNYNSCSCSATRAPCSVCRPRPTVCLLWMQQSCWAQNVSLPWLIFYAQQVVNHGSLYTCMHTHRPLKTHLCS